ncbi:Trafficking protein particle complex subunit 13 [Coemansia sp. RSA 455]|nr:Trafficking protein particle complex subunit 13 [Coemansia sp. RSA 455]
MHPLETFPLSETLVLPRSFGTMYLGETFSAHLCLCNESSSVVREIGVQVVMQTSTQQLQLFSDGPKHLASGQPLNIQVAHEIKELGAHVLGCSVSYLSAQGERRVLQKSFKFQQRCGRAALGLCKQAMYDSTCIGSGRRSMLNRRR